MPRTNQNGYSLLELVVAFAIASSALIAVFGVASQGVALSRHARDLTAATFIAQSLYAETEVPAFLRTTTRQGVHAGRYQWRVTTQEHPLQEPTSRLPLREVVVEVSWPGRGHAETYRLSGLKPDPIAPRD